jgi:hypothetical protein
MGGFWHIYIFTLFFRNFSAFLQFNGRIF